MEAEKALRRVEQAQQPNELMDALESLGLKAEEREMPPIKLDVLDEKARELIHRIIMKAKILVAFIRLRVVFAPHSTLNSPHSTPSTPTR